MVGFDFAKPDAGVAVAFQQSEELWGNAAGEGPRRGSGDGKRHGSGEQEPARNCAGCGKALLSH